MNGREVCFLVTIALVLTMTVGISQTLALANRKGKMKLSGTYFFIIEVFKKNSVLKVRLKIKI